MHAAIIDRVQWVTIPKYTHQERKAIITDYLVLKLNKTQNPPITITDDGIKGLTNLTELNLGNNKIITDDGIRDLINLVEIIR